MPIEEACVKLVQEIKKLETQLSGGTALSLNQIQLQLNKIANLRAQVAAL